MAGFLDTRVVFLTICLSFTKVNGVEVNIQGVGKIRGNSTTLQNGVTVDSFRGIPYGKPPIGSRRFKAPEKADPWTGVRISSTSPINCPQKSITSAKIYGQEDCLYLNIFRQRNHPGIKTPVMVWVHGGSYTSGSGSDYDGEQLAGFGNVTVVTINYRLGVLGFFYMPGTTTKGNYGLWDQILALKWVQDHIEDFDGDPKQVTIFGESAGSGSVTLLMLSMSSHNLFKRVIAQSGAPPNFWAIQKAQNSSYATALGKSIGCSDLNKTKIVDCIRDKTSAQIIQEQMKLVESHPCVTPTVDNDFIFDYQLDHKPWQAESREILLGFNKDEGSMFVPLRATWNEYDYKAVLRSKLRWKFGKHTDMITDLVAHEYERWDQQNSWLKYAISINDFIDNFEFKVGIINFASTCAKGGTKTFLYDFTYMPKYPRIPALGVSHALEIDFVFGRGFYPPGNPKYNKGVLVANFTGEDKKVSEAVMKLWTTFAKTGKPSNDWPGYDNRSMEYLEINKNLTVKANYNPRRMSFWNKYLPERIMKSQHKACPTTRPVQCPTTAKKNIKSGALIRTPHIGFAFLLSIGHMLYIKAI